MANVLTTKRRIPLRQIAPPAINAPEPAANPRRVGCQPLFRFPDRPSGVTVDREGTVYLSGSDSATIWQVCLDGTAKPLVAPSLGPERLYSPAGIALAPDGSLLVADASAHRVCSVGHDESLRVLAGGSSGYRDGPAAQAAFRFPRSVAVGADGSVFVADAGNDRIRRLLPDGQVTTVAGGPPGGQRDGRGRAAGLRWPAAVAVGDDGWLWVADYGNSTVRSIDPAGETSSVFEIPGLGWPSAVAALPGGRAVVAGSVLDDRHGRIGCLMVIGDGR